MNILGFFILTLSWGYIRTQVLADNQRYSPQAYQQHLPSQDSAVLAEEQRIYLNWLGNKRLPQKEQTAPIRPYENVNSLPLLPQLNQEQSSLTNINEPYNLPQQNQINLDLKRIPNTQVLQEPYRQNIQLRDVLFPKVKYIQETPESINYRERNQELSNTPLRQNFGVQKIFSDPKIRKVLSTEEQTKRYMVLYPDGRVSHVDNVDLLLKSNPDHILINSKDLARSKIDPYFLRQTGNSEVSDPQNLTKKPTEPNVANNPINIILNETSSTSTSKPLNDSKSNPVIVVQSLELQPHQTKTIQTSTESNKIQPEQESKAEDNPANFTTTSTNVTVTTKNYNQTTEPSIVPVNPIDNISPILNNTVQIGNNKTSNESNITPQKNQTLEVEVFKDEINENKVNNESGVKSNNITEPPSVLTTTSKPPKAISLEKDSETLDNNRDPSISSSNSSQSSEDDDDSSSDKEENESSTEQRKSGAQTVINSSIHNLESEAKNKTQEDGSLESNSSDGNSSDCSLEVSEEQDKVSPSIAQNSTISQKGKGKVTSQDGNPWKKVTVEKDDFDVVYSFDLPLQPISLVDSDGESHPCLRLLDPTALLTHIICQ